MAMMKNKKDGFSFIEVVVVALIIGVLAALAFPSFRIQMMKVENQEAIRILLALGEAEVEYYRENGEYTSDLDKLTVEIPTIKNFTNLLLTEFPVAMCDGPIVTGRITLDALHASYRLYLLDDGRIMCRSLPGTCPGDLCKKMGFPDW